MDLRVVVGSLLTYIGWIGLYDSERNQVEDEVRSSNLCEKFGIEIENGKVSSLNSKYIA